MQYIITSIGVLVIVIGVFFAAMPQQIRDFISFAKIGKRIYIGGVVRLTFGILLLIASPHASLFWIPVVIGCLMTISGILIFLFGTERIHAFLDFLASKPDNTLRIFPTIGAIFGILLVYSA